jgi:hypothetical protein
MTIRVISKNKTSKGDRRFKGISLGTEVIAIIEKEAKKQKRSFSSQVEFMLEENISEHLPSEN